MTNRFSECPARRLGLRVDRAGWNLPRFTPARLSGEVQSTGGGILCSRAAAIPHRGSVQYFISRHHSLPRRAPKECVPLAPRPQTMPTPTDW